MIYLITGVPGAGKTLRAITRGIELRAQGREVFALGVNGLNHEATGIAQWEPRSLSEWQELPTGAVLIVDECQQWLPVRPAGAKVPEWVEALTRNRHLGVDLIFVTQDARNIDAFVRRLVQEHELLRRYEGGFNAARVFRASQVVEDPKRDKALKGAEWEVWKYPAQNFALYKSADAHTMPRRVPQVLRALVLGLLGVGACVGVAGLALAWMGSSAEEAVEVAAPMVAAPAAATAPRSSVVLSDGFRDQAARAMTAEQYVASYVPLIEGMPWTAPAFAGRAVVSEPEIYCMSSERACRCLSEQGTTWVVQDGVCRHIARHGVYNPHRRADGGGVRDAGVAAAAN